MTSRLPYRWVARILAAILFLAAGLKIYGFRVEPVSAGGIFSAVEIQVALVEFEIVLALWLWSGVRPILSWLVALVTFSIFAVASGYLAWFGQSSCGCFGAVRVKPIMALGLDAAILIGLTVGQPDLKRLWESPLRIILQGARAGLGLLAVMAALFALFVGLIHLGFGSLPEAMAYFRGDRVEVRPTLVNLGEGQRGEMREVVVELANWTDKPVRIIGASHDCSCNVYGLPLTIPAKQSRSLSLTLRMSGPPGVFTRGTGLLVDDDGLKPITVVPSLAS